MSKMKHLLRKFHIGDHHRPPALDSSPPTTPFQPSPASTSSSSPTDLPQTTSDLENQNFNDFNFFEEEFQVELALAISVSDQGPNDGDPETAQINAAKQISLGCSPAQSLSEFLSLRYWSCSVVNYDEKVIDGFYDVSGINSNLVVQEQMPSLLDLEAMSVLDSVGYEVVLVNRVVDRDLQKLEEKVYIMSMECHAFDAGLKTSFLVQRIANLIVDRMGGPVSDAEDMSRRWKTRSYDLRIFLNTIVLPLGSLDVGHSRHRALLFKVLADRINLPCKLVKGSYYTGTDDGAVNLIKLDNGSEYIIDLMGAPGTLIPAEVPSGHLRNFGLDTRSIASLSGTAKSSCTALDEGVQLFGDVLCKDNIDYFPEGLAVQQLKMDPAVSNPGHNLSSNTLGEEYLLVNGQTDEVVQNNGIAVGDGLVQLSGEKDELSLEVMGVACSDQSNASKVHNLPIDPMPNGVSRILWEDLQIGERIDIGSYGEVYRAEWNGTEVAVKKLMKQDISGNALSQFKCEVDIMLRLRHPNVVLFMGAVTIPPNLSILTEFLPRGSLYKLLHRPNIQIDEKRRIRMALDVAKGMNYLHTSQPIIVHRDLKTPNLLVDKNWVVKVCDFGMSRLQHHTFLSSKSTAGTAEWMAPEVLRNEPSNEKSDVYSFGVILWELATLRVPWTEMNSMQVIGAVGFQGRHLDIPLTVDPLVAEIISDCWDRNPQARPSFGQVITRLKCLQCLNVQKQTRVNLQ
ncbi:Serine/threonine-protein kinase CTR1 [Abeliophyllum distichum]|uniref:non-specific serine/threonine protein kinase n=1 Tax=Abeliophyllum distichum TaxID=126358 RepID=A0ABD1TYP9_9LAMI